MRERERERWTSGNCWSCELISEQSNRQRPLEFEIPSDLIKIGASVEETQKSDGEAKAGTQIWLVSRRFTGEGIYNWENTEAAWKEAFGQP